MSNPNKKVKKDSGKTVVAKVDPVVADVSSSKSSACCSSVADMPKCAAPKIQEPRKIDMPKAAAPVCCSSSSTSDKKACKKSVSPEERKKMVEMAAYYIAERHGFKGDSHQHWAQAEKEVEAMLSK